MRIMNSECDLKVQAFDYVQYAFSKYHNHQVNACIKLSGQIEVKVLEEAVNFTTLDLPQLLCRFQKGEYYKCKDKLRIELINSSDAEKDVDKVMAETLSIENGIQVRIAIIRADKKDTIVVVMSHLLCDGMSLKRYIYLLCNYYNALLDKAKISHSYEGKKRGIDWLKNCKMPQNIKIRIKPRKEQIKFSMGKTSLFAKCYLDKKYYEPIKTYLKKNNVTMNDLIMAVYYKAVWEEFHYPLQSICCAMDLRRYIDNKDDYGLCNQTGNAFTTIEKVEAMSFKELLQEVHKQMGYEKEEGLCLKQVKVLEKAFRILPHNISEKLVKICISNPQVALTNLGVIDKDKITFQGLETLDCYLSPSLKKAPNFQMAVSTFEKNILLEVNMIVDKEGKEKIDNYLKRYVEILKGVVLSTKA